LWHKLKPLSKSIEIKVVMKKASGIIRVLVFIMLFVVLPGEGIAQLGTEKQADAEATEKFQQLRAQAKAGNPIAQLRLGNEYFMGRFPEKNYTIAALWYRKAAQQGNSSAQFNLALCYERGLGVEKNRFEAFQWYKKAAKKELKQAKFNLALCYAKGIPPSQKHKTPPIFADEEVAEKYLKELAAEDFIPACRELAILYLDKEKPKKQEVATAVTLLKEAATKGDAPAMRKLADCYYLGLGVEKSPEKMLSWLLKADKKGDMEAKAKLAYCYEYGQGLEQDIQKAFKLYSEAAKHGLPMAQVKMGDYYSSPDSKVVKENILLAIKWYEKAAEKDSAVGIFKLAVFAAEGIGQAKDDRKAAQLFFKSAKLGYVRAQYNLACFFEQGKGVPQDPGGAFYWFKQAALQGDPRAQTRTAFCLLEGKGTNKNSREGLKWLAEAARNGDPEAIEFLRGLNLN
jgi:TPR repeat protein